MSALTIKTVGPYKIRGQLGQGGMATVYKAYHPALDRHVAIKIMDATLGKEPDFIERFKREARVIANLDNVHIVPVYDFGQYKGQPYFVLKFIDGQTLRDRMRKSVLSNSEILEIVLAVGDGLQYAHERGVLHRDIKPANIMISQDGKIYLTDFGLARIIEGTSSLTGERIVGTPYYISPEQALNTKRLDEGTDIYSFGVMIFEMIVGCLPYDGKTVFSIIEDHINTPPPAPRSIKPELTREVEAVILKALAKKRSDRYDKVASLVRAFKKAWVASTDLKTISSRKSQPSQMAALLGEDGRIFSLTSENVVLGRDSTARNIRNDIDLTDLDVKKIVSRRQARVQTQNNEFLLFDLNSRNGTFLNGERLVPDKPHTLVPGDVIEFGSKGVKLTFTRESQTAN
jgi:serine/threonine protein kinase